MSTHSSETIKNSLDVYRNRAKNEYLIWCEQIIDLILKYCSLKQKITISDIGCNYFQLWKEIKRRKLENKFNYTGFDLDKTFINLGLEFFPELTSNYDFIDIEKESIRKSQIVICSALYEHLDNYESALENLVNSTGEILILRTFLGKDFIRQIQNDKTIVDKPYNINQFSMSELVLKLLNKGFTVEIIRDKATNNSSLKKVSGQIERQMFILLCKK